MRIIRRPPAPVPWDGPPRPQGQAWRPSRERPGPGRQGSLDCGGGPPPRSRLEPGGQAAPPMIPPRPGPPARACPDLSITPETSRSCWMSFGIVVEMVFGVYGLPRPGGRPGLAAGPGRRALSRINYPAASSGGYQRKLLSAPRGKPRGMKPPSGGLKAARTWKAPTAPGTPPA